jgi:hypothetical protein
MLSLKKKTRRKRKRKHLLNLPHQLNLILRQLLQRVVNRILRALNQ